MKSFFLSMLLLPLASMGQQLQFDPNFPGGAGSSGTIFSMEAQPNDRVVVGGDFTTYHGQAQRSLVRILPNGQRDTTFQVGTGAPGRINVLRLMPDGRLFIGGLFETYNGFASKNLARLNANGSRDTSFQPGAGLNNEVLGMETWSTGEVLLGGFFSQYQGQPVTQPLKLLANGQRDTAFNSGGTGTFGLIEVIRRQPDGKILLAGSITQFNGQAVGRGVIRLLPNGQLDTSFHTGTGLGSGSIRTMELQPDGKIIVAGNFISFNGSSVARVIRLLPNGQRDATFNVTTTLTSTIVSVLVRRNGNVIAFSNHSTIVGQLPHVVAEFGPTGVQITQSGPCIQANSVPNASVELSDSTVIVAGGFTLAGGLTHGRIGRLIGLNSGQVAGQPIATITSPPLCPGDPATLQVTGALNGATQWVWYAGGCGLQAVGTGTTLVHFPTQTTTYYVRGEGSCQASGPCDSVTVVVNDNLPPVPNTTNLPILTAVCALTAVPPLANDQCAGLVTATTNDPTSFSQPGNYQILWTYTDPAGNSVTQTQQVQIDTIDVRLQFVNGDLLALNTSADAYQWLHCNQGYAPVPGADSSRFLVPMAGDWAVAITQNGCTDTSACFSVLGSSLETTSWLGLQLYPNPTQHAVTLDFDAPLLLQLYDLQGRMLYETRTTAGSNHIQLPDLPQGVYVWHLRHGQQLLHRRQLIR